MAIQSSVNQLLGTAAVGTYGAMNALDQVENQKLQNLEARRELDTSKRELDLNSNDIISNATDEQLEATKDLKDANDQAEAIQKMHYDETLNNLKETEKMYGDTSPEAKAAYKAMREMQSKRNMRVQLKFDVDRAKEKVVHTTPYAFRHKVSKEINNG